MARAKSKTAARSRAGRSSSRRSAESAEPRSRWLSRSLWLVAAGVWLYLALALVWFSPGDAPSHAASHPANPPENITGIVGSTASYWLLVSLGSGAWVLMGFAAAALVTLVKGDRIDHPVVRTCGAILVMLAVGGLHAQWMPEVGSLPGAKGGLVPLWIVGELLPRFGAAGTSLALLLLLLIGAVVAAERLVSLTGTLIARGFRSLESLRGIRISLPRIPWPRRLAVAGGGEIDEEEEPRRSRRWRPVAEEVEEEEEEEGEDDEEDDEDEYEEEDEEEGEEEEEEADEDFEEESADAEEPSEAARAALSEEALREKIAKLPVRIASSQKVVAKDEDLPRPENFEGYQFPGLDLLEDPEDNFSQRMEAFVRDQAQALETALRTFQIDAEVTGIESGPVVTLYSVQLAPGTRVARLQAIASDVARSLQAQNIRIIPNMVGKTTVGIEVPNRQKEKVRLKELMSGGHAEGMALPMFLGKDAAGEPLVLDLARMPHMLIAGTTGSGKSVCINTIIMGWLYTRRPDELKLVLVDPKMVELSMFGDIPHLMSPVVTEMGRAAAILEWAVDKMEERYELLKEAGVRDIAGYNTLGEEELVERLQPANDLERARIPKRLPYMVFVIDELADLMMTHREVEHSIVRIAQKARAVGIHLILATQRPQANVVTGLIKSNMPCRVAFKVASGMDSRIVLDSKGAELLLGQGDMLVLTPAGSELRRCQGTLVADGEARKVTKFLKNVAMPTFERSLVQIRGDRSASGGGGGGEEGEGAAFERDPLFEKAVEIIIESGRGSVSLLQRRLAIGYGRSSRLIDQMGLAGILGEHKGSVAREVLITLEDWKRMRALEEGGDDGEQDSDHGVPAEMSGEYRQ
jgi:S-DNA-T family DNA segregation ATPase FtsK/SpoIIIE